MAANDGGPAFPGIRGEAGYGNSTGVRLIDGATTWVDHNQGMTLRQWYAGMAMLSLRGGDFEKFDDMAHDAFMIADAMIVHEQKTVTVDLPPDAGRTIGGEK